MPRRLAAFALPVALAALLLTGCTPERAASSSSDAPAAVEPAPVGQPTPVTQPQPSHPAIKDPAVQPKPTPGPGAAKPGDALDVEVFAYQALALADEGAGGGGAPADAPGAGAKSIIVLVARGKHRSGGWSSELVELPMRIFPPEFELRTTPPGEGSMNIQMISPFTTAAWVRMDQPVPALKVRVNGEVREVKVEPANKVKNAMPSGR